MVRPRQPNLARSRDLVRHETLRRRAPATACSSSAVRSFADALSPNPLEQADNRHTIVLLQLTKNRSSRTFMDYEKTSLAMDAICSMFEKRLKEMYPERREIDYEVSDLYNYIDALADLSADTRLQEAVGKDVCDNFLANKEAEWDRYIAAVGEHVEGDQMTDWERNEYLPYH